MCRFRGCGNPMAKSPMTFCCLAEGASGAAELMALSVGNGKERTFGDCNISQQASMSAASNAALFKWFGGPDSCR